MLGKEWVLDQGGEGGKLRLPELADPLVHVAVRRPGHCPCCCQTMRAEGVGHECMLCVPAILKGAAGRYGLQVRMRYMERGLEQSQGDALKQLL
jgi:hypothetical protein